MNRQWFILFVVMGITAWLPNKTQRQRDKSIFLAAAALILFSGMRSWWFGDLTKYYHVYLDAWSMSFREIYEADGLRNIGISLIFKEMSTFFGKYGYDYCIFLIALFSGWAIAAVISRYSPSPYYSFMLYVCMGLYSFTYSGLKQTIAMGFCCFALMQMMEGHFLRFLLLTLLGGLFHTPALLFLLTWPVARRKINWSYFIMFGMAIVIVFVLRDQIADFLETAYYSADRAEELVATQRGVGGKFVMMVMILIGATFFRPPSVSDTVFSRLYGVMGLAAVFQMFSVYNNIYTRLADYFFQFVVIFAPMFLQVYEHDENGQRRHYGLFTNRQDIIFLAGLAITLFALWFYRGQVATMQKYYFFWEFDAHHWYGA